MKLSINTTPPEAKPLPGRQATPAYYGRDDDTKGCGVNSQRNTEQPRREWPPIDEEGSL